MKKGKLYLIPTTIGETSIQKVLPSHNSDIINTIEYFIVEELRTARRFLKKAGIIKAIDELNFYTLNEHTKPEEIFNYLEMIEKGYNIGLLSEAGVPCIADPGAEIVKIAQEKNIDIIPLIGPSSILLSLMGSGFNGQNFAFLGYLPIDKKQRSDKLKDIERNIYQNNQTQIFIEAPYRNNQMIEAILNTCRNETMLCIACELTSDNEFIKTKSIASWKKTKFDFHKKNTVFLIYK